MKILLTGSDGQVGREIQDLAAERKLHLTALNRVNLDISNKSQVNAIINEKFSMVINSAAYTNVDGAEHEPEKAYEINRDGVENLALACRKYDIPLLHISTDYVFDGKKNGPYYEQDMTHPINIYGQSKLAGEEILAKIWHKHISLRVSLVFGKYGNNFVKKILQLAEEKDSLDVATDQCSCPTGAADIARVLLKLSEKIHNHKTHWGVYHYAGFPVVSRYEFVREIMKRANKKIPINKITTAGRKTLNLECKKLLRIMA